MPPRKEKFQETSHRQITSGPFAQTQEPTGTNAAGLETAILDRIAENTYPTKYNVAKKLYTRLRYELGKIDGVINFGQTALDIGGRDGRYTHVIRELGPTAVTVVDPDAKEVQKGIASEFIAPQEAFTGTLEEYVAGGGRKVDSAFIFNIPIDQASSNAFINAVLQAVKPGGIVVCTSAEAQAISDFADSTLETQRLLSPLYERTESGQNNQYPGTTRYDGTPNHFVLIGIVPDHTEV